MQAAFFRPVRCLAFVAIGLQGCTSISIAPTCPNEVTVGESGTVWAEELEPGAVPTYRWEAVPSDAVTFEDSASPITKFEALKAGEVIIWLTASDGLYQVTSQCRTSILELIDVAVSLTVEPIPTIVGESATLTCTSVGETEAVTLTLDEVGGATVTLASVAEGIATFTPAETGELTFQCIGRTEGGVPSEPDGVTIAVEEPDDGNGGRPPPRGGPRSNNSTP